MNVKMNTRELDSDSLAVCLDLSHPFVARSQDALNAARDIRGRTKALGLSVVDPAATPPAGLDPLRLDHHDKLTSALHA
jgi:sugar phosphate isomerase/epimerase